MSRIKILKRLWKYLYAYKWLLTLALILTLASNGFALVGPLLSGFAIDALASGPGQVDFEAVLYFCTLMVIFYVLASAMAYSLSLLMIHLSQKVVYQMRKDVFEHLSTLRIGYFDQHQTGDLISRFTYDIDTINASLSNDLIQISTSLITVIGSLSMMLLIAPPLVLVFVITIPISIFYTRYMTNRVRPLFKKRSAKLGELNGFVEETLSAQQSIKAYHQEETMLNRFDVKNNEAVEAYFNAEYYSSTVGPSVNFINNLSLSLVSMFGAFLFLMSQLTLGNLSSFVLYSRKFSGPINEVANISSELQSSLAAAERVFKLLDEKPEPIDDQDAHVYEDVQGEVKFRDVKFGYKPDTPVLHKLNLHVQSGQLIAIVGPTGAGKTTLVNLLMRFYDPVSGEIMMDGVDIKKASRLSLRSSFAMVLQDTWLFHGTVFDNIAYGNPTATRDDVIKAAKAAKIHRYINNLPKGYDSLIEEDGSNISKGQKQLLTIARAMLMDAKILILDEATSSVDTQTEYHIAEAMRTLMKGKTCFVIAHRLSTIINADNILVMESGDVVEQGTHQELLKRRGKYHTLYKSQFE